MANVESSTLMHGCCRVCPALCPIVVTIEDGKAVKVTGDRDSDLYDGYSCPKGRALPDQHNDPNRLLQCMKRNADGSFSTIQSSDAIAEITAQVQDILQRYGPRSIAMYFGSGSSLTNPYGVSIAAAWFQAIKSRMIFWASSIDKPGANVAIALHGNWVAGAQSFDSSDTWMLVGCNPLISKNSGVPSNNPGGRLKEAAKRGMKFMVIDPRRTETTKHAYIHLQARPGEDPTLLAGIINIIIQEELCDREFIARNAKGFEALRAAVAAFTPEYVAKRADVAIEDLYKAARTFGRGKRGGVACATGPSFATHSNLTFYLAMCLNTLCGRWAREGDIATYQNVLLPEYTPKAQPYAPFPPTSDFALRVYGLKENVSGMPSAALADEILLEGDGQVRVLFLLGGNPMLAWPDQRKVRAAMQKLDLLVVLDPLMSATAKYAHYILPPRLSLEVPGSTGFMESIKYIGVSRGYEQPWAQYSPKMVDPPAGSDLVDEHELFFAMAQRMNLSLNFSNHYGLGQHIETPGDSVPLDMSKLPSFEEMLELSCKRSRVPLSDVKKYPHGHLYEELQTRVAPRDADCTAFLQLADPQMMQELAEVRGQNFAALHEDPSYPYLMICRRTNNYMNSMIGQTLRVLHRGKKYNPAFMHPDDLQALQIADGTLVVIRSRHGEVRAIVEADDSLRRGLISISHGYGGAEDDDDPLIEGTAVARLISMEEADPITGIPRMSALPVRVEQCATQ